jgi:hypothetical protein
MPAPLMIRSILIRIAPEAGFQLPLGSLHVGPA